MKIIWDALGIGSMVILTIGLFSEYKDLSFLGGGMVSAWIVTEILLMRNLFQRGTKK